MSAMTADDAISFAREDLVDELHHDSCEIEHLRSKLWPVTAAEGADWLAGLQAADAAGTFY